MNRYLLTLAAGFSACVLFPSPCFAQRDSTAYYDLGYLRLDKRSTQSITIKGSDLEKMPFTNLSDVLGVWTYGAYSGRNTLLYVVDGLPVGEVNGYNIRDIEEIVLVENASALLYTGGTQQEIVLITTKRGKGKRGMTAAGQTGLISRDSGTVHPRMRWYHDYFVRGWLNSGKWSMGLSGDYQRDAWPLAGGTSVTPYNLERWRMSGYAAFRPDAQNEVEVAVNIVPQRMAYAADSVVQGYAQEGSDKARQVYWLPRLCWRGEWLPGLRNELEGRYLSSRYREQDLSGASNAAYGTDSKQFFYDTANATEVIVREALHYSVVLGGWRLSPGFTATYQHRSYRQASAQLDSFYYAGAVVPNWSYAWGYESEKGHFFTLTPAFDLSYRDVLDIQGGALRLEQPNQPSGEKKDFPFVTGAVDVLRAIKAGAGSSLRFYGSYAKRIWTSPGESTLRGIEGLADLSGGTGFNVPGVGAGAVGINSGVGVFPNLYRIDTVPYWVWEAGVGFAAPGGRIRVGYTFERRNFYKEELIPVPYGGNGISYAIAYAMGSSSLHHISVEVKAGGSEKWEWRSAVRVTLLRSVISPSLPRVYETGITGDIAPDAVSWTGGWVNRIRLGRLAAGLDLLWHSGETLIQLGRTGYPDTTKLSSVLVPAVHAGYRIPLSRERRVEVFVESRGLLRSSRQDLADDRRYYTIGAVFGMEK